MLSSQVGCAPSTAGCSSARCARMKLRTWSVGVSQNLLDELRFADEWDNKHWGSRRSAKDLLTMATFHAAYSLQLRDQIGQIKAGLHADLSVIDALAPDPYGAMPLQLGLAWLRSQRCPSSSHASVGPLPLMSMDPRACSRYSPAIWAYTGADTWIPPDTPWDSMRLAVLTVSPHTS